MFEGAFAFAPEVEPFAEQASNLSSTSSTWEFASNLSSTSSTWEFVTNSTSSSPPSIDIQVANSTSSSPPSNVTQDNATAADNCSAPLLWTKKGWDPSWYSNCYEAEMLLPALNMAQASLALHLAYLRFGWDALSFKDLVVVSPNTARNGKECVLVAPERQGDDAWLKQWTTQAHDEARRRRIAKARLLVGLSVLLLTVQIVFICCFVVDRVEKLRDVALLTIVDAAFVTGGLEKSGHSRSALLVLMGHVVVSLEVMTPLLKHAAVAACGSLRFGFLMASTAMRTGMTDEQRLLALRGFVAFQRRPSRSGNRWVPGPRLLWTVLLFLHMAYYALSELAEMSQKKDEDSQDLKYNTFRSAWCAFEWQDRLAGLALPFMVLAFSASLVGEWLRQGHYSADELLIYTKKNILMMCLGVLVVMAMSYFWSIFPAVGGCVESIWATPFGGPRSFVATFLGISLGAVFWGRWISEGFQADPSILLCGFAAIVLCLVGTPWRMDLLVERGPTPEELPMFLFQLVLLQSVCAVVIWRSYFGTGFRLTPLAKVCLAVWPITSVLFGLFLWRCPESLNEFSYGLIASVKDTKMKFGHNDTVVNKGSVVLALGWLSAPILLFYIVLKGEQIVQLARAEDGGDEEERDSQKKMRERCTIQLMMVFGELTVLLGVVAGWTKRWFMVFTLLLWLGHFSALVYQWEFILSQRRYPFSLKMSWALLYGLSIVYCIVFGIYRNEWLTPLIIGPVTEFHMSNLGFSSHLRAVQGLSFRLRSVWYTYDPLEDRVVPMWGVKYHPRFFSVVVAVVWCCLVAAMNILPRAFLCWAGLRICLGALFNFHQKHQSDVPAWFLEAQPRWALEEGILVWGGKQLEAQTPRRLIQLLEDRAGRVHRLHEEKQLGEHSSAISHESKLAKESGRRCELLWEYRVGIRLQGAVDHVSSSLLALCASLDVPAKTIDDVFRLEERIWQQLLSHWELIEARTKQADKLKRQEILQAQAYQQQSEFDKSDTQNANQFTWPQMGDDEIHGHTRSGGLRFCDDLYAWWNKNVGHVSTDEAEEELEQLRMAWQESKKKLAAQASGMFSDHKFPASHASLGSAAQRVPGAIWLRPHELFKGSHCVLRDSTFSAMTLGRSNTWSQKKKEKEDRGKGKRRSSEVAEYMTKHINQGMLGDCWLLSAMSVLCTRPTLLERMFLDSPEISHCGAYCFRLHEDGVARSIVVDDRIPANQIGMSGAQPTFARPQLGSNDEVVLWPLLLEKAFAKLYGSYGAIEAGQVHEALMDMTGGLGEIISLKGQNGAVDNADHLWAKLVHLRQNGHLLTAGSVGDSDAQTSPRGIVQGHAYSILQVRQLNGGIRLVKLRNPWGQGEWRGDFGARSPLWTPDLRAKLRYQSANDGIIWMPMRDFVCEFSCIYVCRIFPLESFDRQVMQSQWLQSDRQVIPLRVEGGSGLVCMQLQQADDRKTMTGGCPIRLSVTETSDSQTAKNAPYNRKWKQETPVTAQRECALDVKLEDGVYNVMAQVCGRKRGKFALTVFHHRSMRIVLGIASDQSVASMENNQGGDFGLSGGVTSNFGCNSEEPYSPGRFPGQGYAPNTVYPGSGYQATPGSTASTRGRVPTWGVSFDIGQGTPNSAFSSTAPNSCGWLEMIPQNQGFGLQPKTPSHQQLGGGMNYAPSTSSGSSQPKTPLLQRHDNFGINNGMSNVPSMNIGPSQTHNFGMNPAPSMNYAPSQQMAAPQQQQGFGIR